jgi:hypothetical protein
MPVHVEVLSENGLWQGFHGIFSDELREIARNDNIGID